MQRTSLTLSPKGVLVLAALALAPALAPTAAHAQFQTVMTGLDNPYGLAVSPDGGLYVAEGGTGNNGAATGPGFINGNGTPVYFGDTGAVSRLQNGVQTRVISGLPSVGPAGSVETTGLQGIAFDSSGQLFGAFGLGGVEAQRTQLVSDVLSTTGAAATNAGDLGQLVRLNLGSNTVTPLSDLVPYETQNYTTNNPDRTVPEANPYGLAALPGGGFAISDGGGNVVLQAPAGGGAPSLLSVLPAAPNTTGRGGPTYQSVPTALALDGKGSLYAAEFTGFPFPAGGASVFRLDPGAAKPFTFAGGFTTITGLTFGPNGNLYVLDETTNGLGPNAGPAQLFQVDPSRRAFPPRHPPRRHRLHQPDRRAGQRPVHLQPGHGGGRDRPGPALLAGAPVPEASTTVSFGLLLALGLGGLVVAAKRKRAGKKAAPRPLAPPQAKHNRRG